MDIPDQLRELVNRAYVELTPKAVLRKGYSSTLKEAQRILDHLVKRGALELALRIDSPGGQPIHYFDDRDSIPSYLYDWRDDMLRKVNRLRIRTVYRNPHLLES